MARNTRTMSVRKHDPSRTQRAASTCCTNTRCWLATLVGYSICSQRRCLEGLSKRRTSHPASSVIGVMCATLTHSHSLSAPSCSLSSVYSSPCWYRSRLQLHSESVPRPLSFMAPAANASSSSFQIAFAGPMQLGTSYQIKTGNITCVDVLPRERSAVEARSRCMEAHALFLLFCSCAAFPLSQSRRSLVDSHAGVSSPPRPLPRLQRIIPQRSAIRSDELALLAQTRFLELCAVRFAMAGEQSHDGVEGGFPSAVSEQRCRCWTDDERRTRNRNAGDSVRVADSRPLSLVAPAGAIQRDAATVQVVVPAVLACGRRCSCCFIRLCVRCILLPLFLFLPAAVVRSVRLVVRAVSQGCLDLFDGWSGRIQGDA